MTGAGTVAEFPVARHADVCWGTLMAPIGSAPIITAAKSRVSAREISDLLIRDRILSGFDGIKILPLICAWATSRLL